MGGRPVDATELLGDGSRIEIGPGVKLQMRRAHPLSLTARLDFLSRHRTQPPADAVLLLADSCVLGPKPHSHVVCRDWSREVILFRHEEKFFATPPAALRSTAWPARIAASCKRIPASAGRVFPSVWNRWNDSVRYRIE